ncbi:MAG: PEP-CTERM sorting domain-containing protein [Alphaproteobacteria bacterium]
MELNIRNAFIGAAVAAPLMFGLSAPSAQATTLTIDPTVAGSAKAPFFTDEMAISFGGLIDQAATAGFGTFTEHGAFTIDSFRLGGGSLLPSVTGLTTDYLLYGIFFAAGTVAPAAGGGLDIVFTTFDVALAVDPTLDTVTTALAGMGDVGGSDNDDFGALPGTGSVPAGISLDPAAAPPPAIGLAGAADDTVVATGGLDFGTGSINPAFNLGDFKVQVTLTAVDAPPPGQAGNFFQQPLSISLDFQVTTDANLSSLTGCSAGTFVDCRATGGGFIRPIPEPMTLGLLGAGLLGLGVFARRRRKAA